MAAIVQEYLIKKDNSSDFIILAIALILLIGFWAIIFFFAVKNPGSTVKAYETCAVGSCPTNKYTGEKRCPLNDGLQMEYDPVFEVCNPPELCTAIETPYAVQSDGSTSVEGKCDIKQCRCVNYLATPSYIETMFTMTNGTLYSTNVSNQGRVIFQQTPSPYVGEGNNVPMIYSDPVTQRWNISSSLLSYLAPSTCAPLYAGAPEPEIQDIIQCITSNPCLAGRMAFLPENATAFAQFNTSNVTGGYRVGCVPNSVENPVTFGGNDCSGLSLAGNLYVPLFNPSSGRIFCYETLITQTS